MKERNFKKNVKKKLLNVIVALAVIVSVLPMGSVKASAKDWPTDEPIDIANLNIGDTIHPGLYVKSDYPFYMFYSTDKTKCFFSTKGDEYSALEYGFYGMGARTTDPGFKYDQIISYDYTIVPDARWKHTWNYTADGNKLTAKCNQVGCDGEPHTASLTIKAEDEKYSGEAYASASIEGDIDAWKAYGFAEPVIMYEGREDTEYAIRCEAPIEEGTYTAEIMCGCTDVVVAKADFEITGDKPKPTPTPTPDKKKQEKSDKQRAEEKKQTEAMIAAYFDFFEHHPAQWGNVNELYAVNPALGVDAAYAWIANITLDEYNAQMAAYFEKYANEMALYEAVTKAQNAQ